jgi:hypothetical protein
LIQQFIPICLAGLAAATVNDGSSSSTSDCKLYLGSNETLRCLTKLAACNKADIALVQYNAESNPNLCETWLNRYAPISNYDIASY